MPAQQSSSLSANYQSASSLTFREEKDKKEGDDAEHRTEGEGQHIILLFMWGSRESPRQLWPFGEISLLSGDLQILWWLEPVSADLKEEQHISTCYFQPIIICSSSTTDFRCVLLVSRAAPIPMPKSGIRSDTARSPRTGIPDTTWWLLHDVLRQKRRLHVRKIGDSFVSMRMTKLRQNVNLAQNR